MPDEGAMSLLLDQEIAPVIAGLWGSISTADGPTQEQTAVLTSIARHLFGRSDFDLADVKPLRAVEAARALQRPDARLRFAEILMTLELCRHPPSFDQVNLSEAYVTAMDLGDHEIELIRVAVQQGAEAASTDLERSYAKVLPEISELSLRNRYLHLDKPDHELAARLKTLHDLPENTLGYQYIEFYRQHGFALPGDDVHLPAHYVNHDMNHVITGYPPTAPGEIARSAFLMAANDSRHNWLEFLLTMSIHESGVVNHGEIRAKVATLDRDGVPDYLADGLRRGAQCTVDLSQVDHLAIAHLPLDQVRENFSVVPPAVSAPPV